MPTWNGGLALAISLALLIAPEQTSAQEQPPRAPEASPEALSVDQARDLARLDGLIRSHAIEARNNRLAAGGVFIAAGLTMVPLGIVAETSWNQSYGIGLWVSGALFLGFGVSFLFVESSMERLDAVFQSTAATLPLAQRLVFGERSLAEVASASRSGRTVSAVVSFALAALTTGIAIGELVSASNTVGSDRSDLQVAAVSGFILGGLFVGAGVMTLLLPTPAETAWAVYASGKAPGPPGVRLSAGVAPIHGGAMVGLGGRF